MKIKITLAGLSIFLLTSCVMPQASKHTDIEIKNISLTDSVKVYLTLQSPNSVIGKFGIKESDTTGSKSQGYFYALKDSSYLLDYPEALLGFNISFQAPPMSCQQAIDNGFPKGINVVEGSINCEYESFDISCVDGVNSVVTTHVTDVVNWSTGLSTENKIFLTATNSIDIESNYNIRGVFPYRCTDCIDINPNNIPKNCFNIEEKCNTYRTCQVNRRNNIGGRIVINYVK